LAKSYFLSSAEVPEALFIARNKALPFGGSQASDQRKWTGMKFA